MMQKIGILIVLCFALTACGGGSNSNQTEPSNQINNIIVFGDSLSDNGNNQNLSDFIQGNISVAPVTNLIPGQAGSPNLSSTWITYLVHDLNNNNSNLQDYTQFLADASATANVNFAWSGALTGSFEGAAYITHSSGKSGVFSITNPSMGCTQPGPNCIPSVLTQIQLYFNAALPNMNYAHTLFIIFAGANDVFANIQTIKQGVNTVPSLQNIVAAIQTLQAHQVPLNNIVVVDLPNLIETPQVQDLLKDLPTQKDQLAMIVYLSGIILAFNGDLAHTLQTNFPSNTPHVYSVYNLMNSVLSNPSAYNFISNADQVDCITDFNTSPNRAKDFPNCDYTDSPKKSGQFVCQCAYPNSTQNYFFFNNIHPSNITHQILAHDMCVKLTQWYQGFTCLPVPGIPSAGG